MSETRETAGNPHRPEHRNISYCPHCGTLLPDDSLVVELWEADETVHHVWCKNCGFAGDVVQSDTVTSHEPEH